MSTLNCIFTGNIIEITSFSVRHEPDRPSSGAARSRVYSTALKPRGRCGSCTDRGAPGDQGRVFRGRHSRTGVPDVADTRQRHDHRHHAAERPEIHTHGRKVRQETGFLLRYYTNKMNGQCRWIRKCCYRLKRIR